MTEIKPEQKYKHFKGNIYEIIAIALDSETKEEQVIYVAEDDEEGTIWIRPKKMFEETIERDGKTIKRFQLIQEAPEETEEDLEEETEEE